MLGSDYQLAKFEGQKRTKEKEKDVHINGLVYE